MAFVVCICFGVVFNTAANLPGQVVSFWVDFFLHWEAANLKGLSKFQNKKFWIIFHHHF